MPNDAEQRWIKSFIFCTHSFWAHSSVILQRDLKNRATICRVFLWAGDKVSESVPTCWEFVWSPKGAGSGGLSLPHSKNPGMELQLWSYSDWYVKWKKMGFSYNSPLLLYQSSECEGSQDLKYFVICNEDDCGYSRSLGAFNREAAVIENGRFSINQAYMLLKTWIASIKLAREQCYWKMVDFPLNNCDPKCAFMWGKGGNMEHLFFHSANRFDSHELALIIMQFLELWG